MSEPHLLEPNEIPIISIFSGAGGLDAGFLQQGFIPVLAIDINQAAVDSYNLNDPRRVAKRGDLAKLTDDEVVDLVRTVANTRRPRGVIGGPPCQGVSSSNVHSTHQDRRKRLLLRYAQIVKALNKAFDLDFFVFENVVGLKSKKHRRYFKRIVRELEDAGFSLFEQELNARNFGVAQQRRRVFIVGINRTSFPGVQFNFPYGDGPEKTVRDVIGDLPDPVFFRTRLDPSDIPYHPNHWAMNPRSAKFVTSNGSGRSFRKLNWDEPSATVAYGHREMHIHPSGTRRVSVYEGMLLQGFDCHFRLAGNLSEQVDQVSNAVPPPLGAALAKAINVTLYERISKIRNELLLWFKQNRRVFPWRQTDDPYKILVAEKLLQQTAATSRVIEAYTKIIEGYPTIWDLAKASPKDILSIIVSLGFSYRARELVFLAETLVGEKSGKIPQDLKSLLALPGIGEYCARAILCFAYDQNVALVDTNIARLLYRVFGIKDSVPKNPARNQQLKRLAHLLLPFGRAKEFNLACLDLCATTCTVNNPRCESCPLQKLCLTSTVANTPSKVFEIAA